MPFVVGVCHSTNTSSKNSLSRQLNEIKTSPKGSGSGYGIRSLNPCITTVIRIGDVIA